MEVVVVCMDGDDGVPNDDVSMPRWGLEEELVGEGEREVGVIEVEEGGGDEGVMKEGGLGGVGVEQGGEEVRVEREEECMDASF